MDEANSDWKVRMDRIDQKLQGLIAGHAQSRVEHERLLNAIVLQKSAIDDLLKVAQEQSRRLERDYALRPELDHRVDALAAAIRKMNSRPPEN